MRILVLGGDGYLGWATAMYFSQRQHTVGVVDNFTRRSMHAERGTDSLTPIQSLHARVDAWREVTGRAIEMFVGDIQDWFKAEQWMLLHWAAFFALFAILAILYGVQFDDPMTRGFGITFLFINLYTRYFELFWDSLHKALFFALLALSFWVVGSHAEKIRNVSILRRRPPPKQGVPNPGEPPS